MPPPAPLLRAEGLVKHFPLRRGFLLRQVGAVQAVDGVSFEIAPGETLSLVGESGCGKTTVGRLVLRLLEPTAGQVWFEGRQLFALRGEEMRRLRRRMQVIFQDPYASLNPRLTVEGIVGEGLLVHRIGDRRSRRERVAEVLERVGLDPGAHLDRYPHEFSGGQRQRIGIARALVLRPSFIVCDEAVSSLDVSIRAQILNLLLDLQRDEGYSYLFIAHDLSMVRHLSDRVAVMYLGRIVETGSAEAVYSRPHHPYTQALLASAPARHPLERRQATPLEGEAPSPLRPPAGCRFHPRCPFAEERCRREEPPPREVEPGHVSWCVREA
jgi:oligopeptide/dipeptide ABC transporter ATP-binding protein